MLFSSYEKVHHTYLCLVPVLNSILRWRSQLTIFVWYTCHLGTSAHAQYCCIPSAQWSRMLCTGGVPRWVHSDPLRQPRDDSSQRTWGIPSAWVMLACLTLKHIAVICVAFRLYLSLLYIIVHCSYYHTFIMNACLVVLLNFKLIKSVTLFVSQCCWSY